MDNVLIKRARVRWISHWGGSPNSILSRVPDTDRLYSLCMEEELQHFVNIENDLHKNSKRIKVVATEKAYGT